jgi:hypothetical protein
VALLEGCNQVATVNRFRLTQAITASTAVWTLMVAGGQLWAAVAATAARLLCDVYLLAIRYRRFFQPFLREASGSVVRWSGEVWPLQWRLALQGPFAYLSFFLFTPVMFHYHGSAVAGRMGMTWTVVTALQAASLAWVQTRVPRFGMLINERKFAELDRLFTRLTSVSVAVMVAGSVTFWGFVAGLNRCQLGIAERLLTPGPTAAFLLAAAIHLVSSAQVMYVRAHKREPFVVLGISESIAIGLAVWWFGSTSGPWGAGWGLLAVRLLLSLPATTYIWNTCRRQWH